MSENEPTDTTEATGRTIKIDTGFYKIEVYGDPKDSFEDVEAKAQELAAQAKKHVEDIDKQLDGGDEHYR